ncbi:MAG TPA: [protein-PII] uridylyltransferase [Syntrophobacteraceae bacterium]|nr:[protein-PII] uridylyltransferase [Syntrophobacteraceae bacterium]
METSLSQLPTRLKEMRQAFGQYCRSDVPGFLAARTYAQSFLQRFQEALHRQDLARSGWAAIAVGGFGRGDLSFVSDLDLLFLHQNRLPASLKEIVRELTYSLWDAGFEVGHVTASMSSVKNLVREDFTVFTSYLEPQFIAGDEEFYRAWRATFLETSGHKRHRRFLADLMAYREKRLLQYGESSYLLEPHIKEGVGGLRDLHVIRWAGQVFLEDSSLETLRHQELLTREEQHWLEQAQDFLWRVRLQLHQLAGKRQDQLLFPEQEQIAQRLGFMDSRQGVAVEAFMRLYYRHTARIRRSTSFFLERLEEREVPRGGVLRRFRRRILPGPFLLEGKYLHFMQPELIPKTPRLLMQFFWQAARAKAHFHHQTGQVIRHNLTAFSSDDRRDLQVVNQFFDILLSSQQAFPVLKVMMETGFLETFIPELAPVRYRVQHDVYHLYTVDEHLLRTVLQLHQMERQPQDGIIRLKVEDAFVQTDHRRVLYLAALIHDIGKGQGKNHSAIGAEMARGIAERLGLDPSEMDLLQYLVANHLILADTAMKRDLSDEKPIVHCAEIIGSRERLRLLYLLTIADSCATGPGAWNTWKASLLRELYVKVDQVLLQGFWVGEDAEQRAGVIQNQILKLTTDPAEQANMPTWLAAVAPRYLLSNTPAAILQHYRLEQRLPGQAVVLEAEPGEGEMWQVTVATHDRPGLFATITGVIWAYGLNILSAYFFPRQSGIALDVLRLERVLDALHTQELWAKMENDLSRILSGDTVYLEHLIASRQRQAVFHRKALPRKEDRVVINEEASDAYTVVEVYTWDRPGVLHTISKTLFEQGISIQLAKISTPGAQVADVFYVTDLAGNKLLDARAHEGLRDKLLECLTAQQ